MVEHGQLFQEFKAVLSSPNEDVQFPVLTQLHSLLRLLYSDSTEYVCHTHYSEFPLVWTLGPIKVS